ncbi:hypothetical protein K0U07_00955, partial [bacterium]|nr:hypothetical protein [bacterium]
ATECMKQIRAQARNMTVVKSKEFFARGVSYGPVGVVAAIFLVMILAAISYVTQKQEMTKEVQGDFKASID